MLFRSSPSRADFDHEVMPHLDALYSLALRLTRRPSDAEDLVQDTVLRAFRFWGGFAPGTNAKAWLFKILTNQFRNRYREREREQQILGEAGGHDVNLARFVGAAPDDGETAFLGRMVSKDVERALAAVPEEFRLAVILADLEDCSYKEIAEIMDCPAGTVMSRLFRGRKLLQRLLHDYAVEQGILPAGTPPADAADAAAPLDLASYRRKRHEGGAS